MKRAFVFGDISRACRCWFKLWCLAWVAVLNPAVYGNIDLRSDGYHVFPGDNIQDAIELASLNKTNKRVKVHPGVYSPAKKGQALIWFNKAHDGVCLEAQGTVTLSAANPALSDPKSPSHPAVVNHVIYFGDGVSSNTCVRGFRVTGANHFVTTKGVEQIEPDRSIRKNTFFLMDGAIKVFGRSYPLIERLEVFDNYASPCAGGISVQHQGFKAQAVIIRDCAFRRNRAQVTGAAIDLLAGSFAIIENCLFVENVSNTGPDIVAEQGGGTYFTNSGVLTVFQNSKAIVKNSTFFGNRNGVDDLGHESQYLNCIFYQNTMDGGFVPAERFELNLKGGAIVSGCLIKGRVVDPQNAISPTQNSLNAAAPNFDPDFVPLAPEYAQAGYRLRHSK